MKIIKGKKLEENRKFYTQVKDEISKIREGLKLMYLREKNGFEDSIHKLTMRLDRLSGIMFDLLIDGCTPKEIMDKMKGSKSD